MIANIYACPWTSCNGLPPPPSRFARRLRQSQGEPKEIYHWSHEKRATEVNKKGAEYHMWRLFKTLRNKRL